MRASVWQEDPELVPAQPGEPLGVPDRVGESPGEVPDDRVAVVVAEGVDGVPKAIESQNQQGERPLGLLGLRQSGPEAKLHEGTVGQTRELVEEPHVPQRFFSLFLLRHVQYETTDEPRAAVGARHHASLVAPPEGTALPIHDPVLADEPGRRAAGLAVAAKDSLPILGVEPVRPHVRLGKPLSR